MHGIFGTTKRFIRDERGSLAIEMVLIAPMLIWTIVAMYSFWDTFRTRNAFQKATHTVSNIISRTKKASSLTVTDIGGYHALMNHLILIDAPVSIRVTQYTYTALTDTYKVDWSCHRGAFFPSKLTNANLASMKASTLPIMANADSHILLETRMSYQSPFDLNFMWFGDETLTGAYDFYEIVSERPRNGIFSATDPC
jgi:hypothetical protein